MITLRSGYARFLVLTVLVFAAGFGLRVAWEITPVVEAQSEAGLAQYPHPTVAILENLKARGELPAD